MAKTTAIEEAAEPHVPLFIKYRPATFADIAQPHVTRVLKAQIAMNKCCATYMFYGPAGTGKTTSARVMTAAMLCENRQGEEPCGVCRNCIDIREGHHRDVNEVNCATHGKVEDVREMIAERMIIAPTRGHLRVFIMDEAHLLTKQSQNALLKILEEPPSYVKFFICTTEPHKIEPAIRTRCQQHRMGRVSEAAIQEILRKVVKSEGWKAEEGALELIAQSAEGSARSALVVLEQVSTIGVTEENIRAVLCRSAKGVSIGLWEALFAANRAKALRVIEGAKLEGRDIGALMEETAQVVMDIARYKLYATPEAEQHPDLRPFLSGYTTPKGKSLPPLTGPQIIESVTILLDITTKIRQNVPAELIAQVSLLKLIDRIERSRKAA